MNYQDKALLYAKEIREASPETTFGNKKTEAMLVLSCVTNHFARLSAKEGIGSKWVYGDTMINNINAEFVNNSCCVIKTDYVHEHEGMTASQAAVAVYEAYKQEFNIRLAIEQLGFQEAAVMYGAEALDIYSNTL